MRLIVSVLCFLWVMPTSLMGQSVSASARVDTQSLRIGEPLTYTLSVSAPPAYQVMLPAWRDTLGKMDVIAVGKMDSLMQQGNLVVSQSLTLMAFDSGFYRIPAQQIAYSGDPSAELASVQTSDIPVTIYTVEVDTAADIRAIKDIMDQPLTFGDLAPWIFGGLGVALLVGLGIWWYLRRRNNEPLIPRKPTVVIPPHERAMRRLAQIESQKYWQQGNIKQYYVELTEALREYLEGRFQIPALESVSHEIIRDLKAHKGMPELQIKALESLLQLADLAKFAKSAPDAKENLAAMEIARTFVKTTQAVASPPESQELQPETPAP